MAANKDKQTKSVQLPLEGIRVLDWTHWQQGPIASMMLGDLGADVIKIEDRVSGDAFRGVVAGDTGQDLTIGAGRTCFYEGFNRNKRGIAIDLEKQEGREIIYRLVKTADVFVQNYRQSVKKRLGLDYETLAELNPRLIYVNCTGFGPRGSGRDNPAWDLVGQAHSGLMLNIGADPPGTPAPVGLGVGDQMGGIMASYGILAALLARERYGVGQEVEASLLGGLIWFQYQSVNNSVMVGYNYHYPPPGPAHARWNPLVGMYQCGDGRWIALCMQQGDRYWADFCKVVGMDHLAKDPRYENLMARAQHCAELVTMLEKVFATRPSAEWLRLLRAAELIVGSVNTIADLEKDEQVLANDYIMEYNHPVVNKKIKMVGMPVELSKTPGSIRRPAPEWGEHTEEVLLEAGYSWDEIGALKQREII
jgi:CoA:oxalate CoA-transferase